MKQGQLRVKTLAFDVPAGSVIGMLIVTLNGSPVTASMGRSGERVTVTLASQQTVLADQVLLVESGITGIKIVQGALMNGGLQVTWTSVPGKSYAVEFSEALPAASWTPLATNIAASAGATTSFTDTNAGGGAGRFYRIRVQP